MIENSFQSEYFNWHFFFSGFRIQNDSISLYLEFSLILKIRFEVAWYSGI